MAQIVNVVMTTLALVQPSMISKERKYLCDPYFELFGFDIILDRDFNACLLEINTMPALGMGENVDWEVKAPMMAQCMSIVGVLDMGLSELTNAESKITLPKGGMDELDKEIVRQENERNRLSGDGFIRIFPSDSQLEELLVRPPLNIEKFGIKSTPAPSVKPEVAINMLENERIAILITFLNTIEESMKSGPADARVLARLQCFLAAQGYRVVKSGACVRAFLRHFIARARAWTTADAMKQAVVIDSETYSNEEKLKEILMGCDSSHVNNPRLLFR
jgi:hypothetical protein